MMLTACGGGEDGQVDVNTAQPPSQEIKFSDCFKLSLGTHFRMSDDIDVRIGNSSLQGVDRLASIMSDGQTIIKEFRLIDGDWIRFLGDTEQTAGLSYVYIYSDDSRFPVQMNVGQSVSITYTASIFRNESQIKTETSTENITFIGYENLVLAGHTFENSCHISLTENGEESSTHTWWAEGFGVIKIEEHDAAGNLIDDRRNSISQILAYEPS